MLAFRLMRLGLLFFCICLSYFFKRKRREKRRERVDDRLFVLTDFSDIWSQENKASILWLKKPFLNLF